MADVAKAFKTAFDGLTVHEQAFAALPAQIAGQSKAAVTQTVTELISSQTVTGVTAFNTQTGAVIYFPGLGMVNDQLGVAAYTTQQSDSGKKIIVGDSSGVTVTLNASVQAPWFTIIDNDSSAVVILVPSSGAIYGDSSIYANCFGIVFFDGANWWSGSTPIATDSSLGIVQPDNVTITVDSSGVLHVPLRNFVYGYEFPDSGFSFVFPQVPALDANGNPAVRLFNGSAAIQRGVDYTLPPLSDTITMMYAVAAGDLWADYQY